MPARCLDFKHAVMSTAVIVASCAAGYGWSDIISQEAQDQVATMAWSEATVKKQKSELPMDPFE